MKSTRKQEEFSCEFPGKTFGPVDNGAPLFCIAGLWALEVSRKSSRRRVSFLYKSSFDKANRSSGTSFRGVGMAEGLSILAEVADMLQTPAFLCRQDRSDCGRSRHGQARNHQERPVSRPVGDGERVHKARAAGNERICLCERGASFGYGSLVVDMRGLDIMKRCGVAAEEVAFIGDDIPDMEVSAGWVSDKILEKQAGSGVLPKKEAL